MSDYVWRLCAYDRRTGRDVYVSGICACPVNKSDPIHIGSEALTRSGPHDSCEA